MQRHEIAHLFHRTYNGKPNFMTPNPVTYGKRGRLCYEISRGTGIDGRPMYGVTVIEIDMTKRHDLSQSFPSFNEADKYVSSDFMTSEATLSELE